MKKSFIVSCAIVAGLACASLASAGPLHDPSPCNAGFTLQQRIHHGIVTGKLNPREAALLRAGQARLQRCACRMKADRHLTRKEGAHLWRKHVRLSRHIHRLKHNHNCNHKHNQKHLLEPVRYPLFR